MVRAWVLLLAALLVVGAVNHVADFVRGGWVPYPWAPGWVNGYWTSLAVLDTVAAALLVWWRRAGLDLAVVIAVTDLAANLYALHGSSFADEPGLQRLTAFTVLVVVSVPFVRPKLRARTTKRRTH
ncbi:hypothetical protein [Saccharothrix variisporea]|uniref:DoxX-like protein n=1 Tax=Saccharothrix variisporea TaxID=543527 RepID=A0A495X0D3_9PSEU|nr:hypothetical protein [Saccharothrix variisporea]RKT67277.1 hypothetical protein DFJ66_0452 [Saccharothrix variisporea]